MDFYKKIYGLQQKCLIDTIILCLFLEEKNICFESNVRSPSITSFSEKNRGKKGEKLIFFSFFLNKFLFFW